MAGDRSMNRVVVSIVLLVSAALIGGCQGYRSDSTRTVGEFTDDVLIQSRLKLALINDDEIKGMQINTEVNRGVVELHGRVSSRELKQRAVEIASGIKGVVRVEDRLVVDGG